MSHKIIATVLADSDSTEIAEMFNAFADRYSCYEINNRSGCEMQRFDIAKTLSSKAANWFRELVSTYDWQQQEAKNAALDYQKMREKKRELEKEIEELTTKKDELNRE